MKILLQRVSQASVEVENKVVGQINQGLLVFLGVTHNDTEKQAAYLVNKMLNMRIFQDDQGKFNRSLLDVGGEVLVVSQFTLYADCSAGRRPSFTDSAPPEQAEKLYEYFIQEAKKSGSTVASGVFGAKMDVHLINDGPVTIMVEND